MPRPDLKLLHALGRCGTDEAVAILTNYARNETNSWDLLDITCAICLAGERGEAALAGLEAGATGNLKWTIDLWRDGRLESMWRDSKHIEDVPFPDIPSGLRLPSRLV